MLQASQFLDFKLSNILTFGLVAVAYIQYLRDRRKDSKERQEARERLIEAQTSMHSENKNKLETLAQFHATQQTLNIKEDEKIDLLTQQCITLTQIANGIERRLVLLEGRRQH